MPHRGLQGHRSWEVTVNPTVPAIVESSPNNVVSVTLGLWVLLGQLLAYESWCTEGKISTFWKTFRTRAKAQTQTETQTQMLTQTTVLVQARINNTIIIYNHII
jgi:hypothetical protein